MNKKHLLLVILCAAASPVHAVQNIVEDKVADSAEDSAADSGAENSGLADMQNGEEAELNGDAVSEYRIIPVDYNLPKIGFVGVGPIRIGMAEKDMLKKGFTDPYIGEKWQSDEEYYYCSYLENNKDYPFLSFMIVEGKLARIDNHSGGWPIYMGGEIGMSLDQMMAIYGDDLVRSEHPYGGDDIDQDSYLTLTSMGKKYRAIFEITGGKVTSYRFGDSDAVGFIEGCA